MSTGHPMGTGYPRLVDGLAAVPVETGYVIEGGPCRELFAGRTARELFPRLLPMLDGTRAVPRIAAELGLAEDGLFRVLEVLRQRRMLDLLPAPQAAPAGPDPMRTFLRRSLPARWAEADGRLRAAVAGVTGTGVLADLVARLLSRSGVGRVVRLGGAVGDGTTVTDPDVRLVVAVASGPGPGPLAPSVPVLLVRPRTGRILVGPLVDPAIGGCGRCAAADPHADAAGDRTTRSLPAGDAGLVAVAAGLVAVAAGLAAGGALRHLAGRDAAPVGEGILDVGQDRAPQPRPVSRRPDCPDCGVPGVALDGEARDAYAYEYAARTPGGGWEVDRLADDSTAPPRAYLTQPRLPAPPGQELLRMFAATGRGGRRRDAPASQPCRAPAVGPPGSTRAYLLGDLFGTGPGVYHLDGASGEFVALPGDPTATLPGGRTTALPSDPSAAVPSDPSAALPGDPTAAAGPAGARGPVLVLVGDLPALEPVLGTASRRAAYQDAGVVLAQVVADAGGVGRNGFARYGPVAGLSALLDLNPEREIVTAVLDLEPAPGPGRRPRRPAPIRPTPITYRFDDRPVPADLVLRLAGQGQAATDAMWSRDPGPVPVTRCLLYARALDGLPGGLYQLDGADARPLGPVRPGPIESCLADRDTAPAALLLFTAELAADLATHGASGYPTLLTRAAAGAALVRLAAAGTPLAAGLFARLPGWLAAAALPGALRGHRVLYGCALGRPLDPAPPASHPRQEPASRPRQEQERIPW